MRSARAALLAILLVATSAVPTAAAPPASPDPAANPATPRAGDPIPGQLLVRFKAGTTKAQRDAALGRAKVQTRLALQVVPGLRVAAAADPPAAIAALRAESVVAWADQDRYVVAAVEPDLASQWGLHQASDVDIDAPEAWAITTGDPSVVIAIVDSGVDLDHPDLEPNLWTNPGEVAGNGIDDDDNGYIDDIHGWDFWDDDAIPDDAYGHGTHVAGIAAAVGDNGIGGSGVAPDSTIMPLRMMGADGYGSLSDAVSAIDYAWRMGARIANLSWTSGEGMVQPLADVIAEAGEEGLLSVAAAGNNGLEADVEPIFPAALDDPSIISVAAMTATDSLAFFSNYGAARVDLAAPGEGILSTQRGGGSTTMSGTSMAAPFVAGVAALLLAEHPSWTPTQVRQRILETTRPVGALGSRIATGGVLDARAALLGPADAAPAITITSPAPGATFLPGLAVTFKGSATDVEDGNVNASLTWWSTLQGPLGEGPVLHVPDLVRGEHTILAMAADAAGHQPIVSIRVTIGPIERVIMKSPLERFWSIALGPDGQPRIAFSRQDTGTFVTTRTASGAWVPKQITDAETENAVDIAFDGGNAAVAIARQWTSIAGYGDPGIMIASGPAATWEVDRASESCADSVNGCGRDHDPVVTFDAEGRERFLFTRTPPGSSIGLPEPASGIYAGRRTSTGALVIERIRSGKYLGSPSLAIGPDGAAHAVWTDPQGAAPGVWYATDASGGWVATRLSSSPDNVYAEVLVDGSGKVHVLLSTNVGVRLRTRTGATWGGWGATAPGRAAEMAAVLDAAGKIHIAFGTSDTTGLATGVTYATNRSGSWASTSLAGGQAHAPDIAVSGPGTAHVVYDAGPPSPGLRYSTNSGGIWVHKMVMPDYAYLRTGYAVDGRGVAHLAAFRFGSGSGVYVGDDLGGAWAMSKVFDVPGEWDTSPGFAVSALGERHLVYGAAYLADGTPLADPSVYYATDASGTWKRTRIGGNGGGTTRPLVIDPNGRLHVAFIGVDDAGYGLFYATNASGTWTTRRLTTGAWTEPALAIDAAGTVHIAAFESQASGWRLVYLTNEGGAWVRTPLTSGAFDLHASIAIDGEGDPNIAYTRWGQGIRLTDRRAGSWSTRIVDADPDAMFPSLVVESNGTRRLMYSIATYAYDRCQVPLCPDYPGIRLSTGGPTGAFTWSRVGFHGQDNWADLERGRDGSLSAAFTRYGSDVRQVILAPRPNRTATQLVDGTATSLKRGVAATLKATLTTAAGAPLSGKSVVFKVDGVTIGSATTNASGVATRSWTPTQPAGAHTLTIGFIGGGSYLATRIGPRALTVTP